MQVTIGIEVAYFDFDDVHGWCIQDTDMIRDMQDPMNYFDEDEWRYDA